VALARLCDLFDDKTIWDQMQKNAMAQPVGWETSAAAYAALYRDMTGQK
jgi:starch synthase